MVTPKKRFADDKAKASKSKNQSEIADPEQAKVDARLSIKPRTKAALIMRAFRPYGDPDTQELLDQMASQCRQIQEGDLSCVDSMLISQAHSLDAIFAELALRGARNMRAGYLDSTETYLKLALKAQSQCRATLETLAAIKNPPVVFARQANIVNGPQQVNNNAAPSLAHAGQIENQPNELLEHDHGERLDTGTTATASGSHQAVATVAAFHRPAQRQRKGCSEP